MHSNTSAGGRFDLASWLPRTQWTPPTTPWGKTGCFFSYRCFTMDTYWALSELEAYIFNPADISKKSFLIVSGILGPCLTPLGDHDHVMSVLSTLCLLRTTVKLRADMHKSLDIFLNFSGGAVCENANGRKCCSRHFAGLFLPASIKCQSEPTWMSPECSRSVPAVAIASDFDNLLLHSSYVL